MWGLPSVTLLMVFTLKPSFLIYSEVPDVATISNPAFIISGTNLSRYFLSDALTLINTTPDRLRILLAPFWAFAYASPKFGPMPITSPVDFISGPRIGSTWGNLSNGITASFTKERSFGSFEENFCCIKVLPIIALEATFAREWPIALEIKGTVLDARGLTSII